MKNEILKMPEYHHRVILDEWIIMPNHTHLLIELGNFDYHNGIAIEGKDGNGDAVRDDGRDSVEKIHEFSLRPTPNNNPTPTENEIKQYRKARRR